MDSTIVFALLVLAVVTENRVSGHGFVMDPPQRSSAWRYGFGTPENYNDMGLNCGGAGVCLFVSLFACMFFRSFVRPFVCLNMPVVS